MARLKKNGNLSGAIGNIVFVNDGDRAYVRAKGNSPKQSQNTKTEAEIFGWVGQKEKLYRDILKDKLGLISYQYQAVKHKTRLRKTVVKEATPSGTTIYRFQNPDALVGFDFNPKMEWERSTNFYPVYQLDTTGTMMIDIPVESDLATATQKRQRAFAAELLCPIDALVEFLDGDYSESAQEDAADHFEVSETTIAALLANNACLPIAESARLPYRVQTQAFQRLDT